MDIVRCGSACQRSRIDPVGTCSNTAFLGPARHEPGGSKLPTQSFHFARTRGKRSRVEKALPLLVQCRLRMADCMDWTLSGGSLEEAPKTEPVVWLLNV